MKSGNAKSNFHSSAQDIERDRERQIGDVVKVIFADSTYIAYNTGVKFPMSVAAKKNNHYKL